MNSIQNNGQHMKTNDKKLRKIYNESFMIYRQMQCIYTSSKTNKNIKDVHNYSFNIFSLTLLSLNTEK